ncbi:hypothetical protein [Pendulispora albinea]|uniref:Uncharacterized protein n=1 Tax=Pendulispora albinea TaxID=2741071 RepID=A0ABZ2LNW6_9BACT
MSFSSLATKSFIATSALVCASLAVRTAEAADPVAPSGPPPVAAPVATSQTTTTAGVVDTGPSPFAVKDLPSTEKVSPVNRPLLITGAVVLAGTWGTSIGFAYGSKRKEDQDYLYYPVAGPWLDLAHRDCDARPCSNEDVNKALLIADGIGQGLGALAIVTSLFLPEKKTKNWYLIGSEKSVIGGPMRVGTGYGLGALGRF